MPRPGTAMKRTTKRIELWLAAIGLVLFGLALFLYSPGSLDSDDVQVTLNELVRIPLDQLAKAGSAAVVVTVPDSAQWRRILQSWGDDGYLIFAASHRSQALLYCFDKLGIRVEVTSAGRSVSLESTQRSPYDYSTECPPRSWKFRPKPGEELLIHAEVVPGHPLPVGELVVARDWDNLKDKLVGVSLNQDLRPISRNLFVAGLVLLAGATLLWLRRFISARRPTREQD